MSERQRQREQYLVGLLSPVGIELHDLAKSTAEALHQYARFMLTSADAGSASFNTPVIELCRAVESEVDARLSDLSGLAMLKGKPLGKKAGLLSRLSAEDTAALGLDPKMVKSLADNLKSLGKVRSRTGAAHGSGEPRHATKDDAEQALAIAMTHHNSVIPSVARLAESLPQSNK